MHTNINMRALTHTHTHRHEHTLSLSTQTLIWGHLDILTHTGMNTHSLYLSHKHTHTHIHTHARACVHAHTHTHACMHTHTHAWLHIHTHTHTHTHTVNTILLTTKFSKCKRAGATGTGALKQYINKLSFSEKWKVSVNSYRHWRYLIFRTLVQRPAKTQFI